jgi:hypothetical protein
MNDFISMRGNIRKSHNKSCLETKSSKQVKSYKKEVIHG